MGARAFTTYLLDKMETQQIVNNLQEVKKAKLVLISKNLQKNLKMAKKKFQSILESN